MGGVSGEADELGRGRHYGSEFEQLQLQGVYKIVNNSGTVFWIDFKFWHNIAEGVPYH